MYYSLFCHCKQAVCPESVREQSAEEHSWTSDRGSINEGTSVVVAPNVISMIQKNENGWAKNVVRMGEKGKAYEIFVGRFEGKIPVDLILSI